MRPPMMTAAERSRLVAEAAVAFATAVRQLGADPQVAIKQAQDALRAPWRRAITARPVHVHIRSARKQSGRRRRKVTAIMELAMGNGKDNMP
jgi:hypothetical protein